MSPNPRVSIVISTYNRATSLRLTLDSFRWLDYDNFEVVVVNGPSTDETAAVLTDFAGQIKVVQCPERNLSMSRNLGIAAASGDLVAFIDDDAYPDPGWLNGVVPAFDDPEVAAAGGPVVGHTGYWLQARYSLANSLGDAWLEFGEYLGDWWSSPLSDVFVYTIGTNSVFRRDRLVAIGGFDEEFEYYLDETDVCRRLIDCGWAVRATPAGVVHHKFLPSDVRTPGRATKNRWPVIKNKTYFALKHGLRFHSFAEVGRNLSDFVGTQRAEVERDVLAGLLTDDDCAQFEVDVVSASDAGFARFRSGADRTRARSWFDERAQAFRPFTTLLVRDQKLTVCYLINEWPPDQLNGIARVVHTKATGLAARGHVVHVFTRGAGHPRVDLEAGVWVHRVPPVHHSIPEGVVIPQHLWDHASSLHDELVRMSNERSIDVVEAPNWDAQGLPTILSGRFTTVLSLNTPLATLVRMDARADPSHPGTADAIAAEKLCYESADAFVANSPAVVDEVEDLYRIQFDRSRLEVVLLGLERPDLTLTARHDNCVEVLFVGRLEPRKGIDLLLEVIPGLAAAHPHVRFTIVGNDAIVGPDGSTARESFERSAAGAVLTDRVVFTGILDDVEVARRYASCDVFVAPSRFESFGLILVEAMMFGKPVVGSDTGGMRHIVDDGVEGYLVPPGDAVALRRALDRLIRSPELRERMGQRALERYERDFRAVRMVETMEAYYRSLPNRLARC